MLKVLCKKHEVIVFSNVIVLKKYEKNLLFQVENWDSVSNRTDNSIAIFGEI